jgi:hypothetical protein
LEVLQWLRAQSPPCPWNTSTCSNAANGGHLEVLQWLRAQSPPCPWDYLTCAFAAEHEDLELLRWAIENGCPYTKTQFSDASPIIRNYIRSLR